ncbi:hypothetical protein Tco_1362862 [Tanacetum coccineum]
MVFSEIIIPSGCHWDGSGTFDGRLCMICTQTNHLELWIFNNLDSGNTCFEWFHIPDVVHPELPSRNDRIRNSPVGKIGVYSRFFNFANYRVPLSQFLVDILEYFQINLSHLSVIAAVKVSHFEILCRVHGFVPTVEMDLFAFINHANPTKVRIGEREVAKGEVLLLQLNMDRVVPLAGVNDQGNINVQDVGNDDVNEGDGNAAEANQIGQGGHVVDKRKAADGASGSSLPPKKLREDYSIFGIGASTGGKSVVALKSLLEGSTLVVEVGVTTAATVLFVTSSVTPTPEREGPADSISGTGLRTHHLTERFMISSDSSHDYNENDVDDDVTSIVRSSVPPPPVCTAAVAITIIVGATSALVYESGTGQAQPSIFRDSASPSSAEANIAGPS